MDPVFARQYSSRDAHWNVSGATIRKAGGLTPNTAFEKADASDAINE